MDVDVVFDAGGRYVTTLDRGGEEVKTGEWINRPDGTSALRLPLGGTEPHVGPGEGIVRSDHVVALLADCGVTDVRSVQRIDIPPRGVIITKLIRDDEGKAQKAPDRHGPLVEVIRRHIDWND